MGMLLVSRAPCGSIGLTGGIASGKSTVARMLAELGARDRRRRPGGARGGGAGQPALDEIVAAFGREILLADGTLDRKRLGALVFADADAAHALNAITHPRIAAATQARLGGAARDGLPRGGLRSGAAGGERRAPRRSTA